MNYIYPKFDNTTHLVKKSIGVSKNYPLNASFSRKQDYVIQINTEVAVIEEGIGYNCQWSFVKEIGSNTTNLSFWILSDNLYNIGGKESYKSICSLENNPNLDVEEINPYLKEIFIPYVDRKNGLYSVRIQTDYDKILDSLLFENLLNDVFYEGVSLLLESRGYRYDNEYINTLKDKYYTFAYINDDLAETVNRVCEPITFTVSIPLRFFNEELVTSVEQTQQNINVLADKSLILTNTNIDFLINSIKSILLSKRDEIQDLVFPNKFIEGFVLDFEINYLKSFLKSFYELMLTSGFPLNPKNNLTTYEFGLSEDYNLIFIKVYKNGEEKLFNQQLLSQFKLKGEFNSKRIFYYLYNIKNMQTDAALLSINEFLDKYVKYPSPTFKDETVRVNGKAIPSQKLAKFRVDFEEGSSECLTTTDLANAIRSVKTIASWSDPVFHLFAKKQVEEKDSVSADAALAAVREENRDAYAPPSPKTKEPEPEPKKDSTTVAQAAATPEKAQEPAPAVNEAPAEATSATTATDQIEAPAPTPSATTTVQADKEQEKTKNKYGDETTSEQAQKDLENKKSLLSAAEKRNDADPLPFGNREYPDAKTVSDLKTALKQDISDAESLLKKRGVIKDEPVEEKKAASSLIPSDTESGKQNIATSLEDPAWYSKVGTAIVEGASEFGAGASDAIKQITSRKANSNLNTLLYGLYRINFNNLLFNKLFCYLKGADPNAKEIAEIIAKLPPEIINYFNYLSAREDYTGNGLLKALEKGVTPDLKLFCSKNSGLIYYLKGLVKFVRSIEAIGGLVTKISNITTQPTTKSLSPWTVFGKNFIFELEKQLIKEAFNLIRDSLVSACEDPIFNNTNNNFKNPFDTHYPAQTFNNAKNTTDKAIIRDNRGQILDNILGGPTFRELQVGFDREYTIDLIDKLTKDINCILTPQESVELLSGKPTDVTILLIKNIIRSKYSKAPLDLSFLLDDQRLKEFFNQLGQTVDPDVFQELTVAVTNTLSPSQLCSPQQLEARRDLINNKLPKNLGILEKQQDIRNKNARKIFERLQNGEVEIGIDALCSDIDNAEIIAAKQQHLDNVIKTSYSIFSPILSDFTLEAEKLPDNFIEEKTFYRFDSDNKVFGTAKYTLFNSNLGLNFINIANNINNPIIYNSGLSEKEAQGYKIKYSLLSQETDLKELSKLLLPSGDEKELKVVCADSDQKFEEDLLKFIDNGNLIFEFAQDFMFDGEGGTDGSDLQELKYENAGTILGRYINSKEYIFTISLNQDVLYGDADLVNFKLIVNDRFNNSFRILENYNFERDTNEISGILSAGSDDFYDDFQHALNLVEKQFGVQRKFSGDEILSNKIPEIALGKLVELVNDFDGSSPITDDIYILNKLFFNELKVNNKKIIEAIYLEKIKPKLEDIEKFKRLTQQINQFQDTGLFQTETLYPVNEQKLIKKVNFGYGEYDSATSKTNYLLKNFINVQIPIKSLPRLEDAQLGRGIVGEERQKAISAVYEYLLTHPSQLSNGDIENRKNTQFFPSDASVGETYQFIALQELKDNYVGKTVDNLDAPVWDSDIQEVFDTISNLSNFKVSDTQQSAIAEFDKLYSDDESGDSFLDDLQNSKESGDDDRNNKIDQIISIYRKGLVGSNTDRETLTEYADEIAGYLDGYVSSDDISSIFAIISTIQQQTCDGISALKVFLDLYREEESGDEFLADLKSVGTDTLSKDAKDKIDLIGTIFSQVSLNNLNLVKAQPTNSFIKTTWNLNDFKFKEKEEETDWISEPEYTKITDSDYEMEERNLLTSPQLNSISNVVSLKYPKDLRHIKCNINPHYLNLDYLLDISADLQAEKLCNLNGFTPYDIIKIILVEFIYRIHVTDILVKGIPYLATLTEAELRDLHNKKFIVEAVKQFMLRELKLFSPDANEINEIESIYSKNLLKITKDVWNEYYISGKINRTLVEDENENKEIDYFIKKEIKRFIEYSIKFTVFRPNTGETLDEFLDKRQIKGYNYDFAKNEFETAIVYFIAANTIDYKKRAIFHSTISSISRIFFGNIGNLTDVEEQSTINNFSRDGEDVIQFLTKLSYSADPASMAIIRPEYSKYVKKFILFLQSFARKTLETVAVAGDKNIQLTKAINTIATISASLAWSFLDRKSRIDFMLKDVSLTSKRTDDGKAPFPDVGVSGGVVAASAGTIIPGGFGIAYLTADTIGEVIWYIEAVKELRLLKQLTADQDPCETPEESVKQVINSIDVCTEELYKALKRDINSLEESTLSSEQNTAQASNASPANTQASNTNTPTRTQPPQDRNDGARRRAEDRRDGRSTNTRGNNEDL